jgi:hypothetical protein
VARRHRGDVEFWDTGNKRRCDWGRGASDEELAMSTMDWLWFVLWLGVGSIIGNSVLIVRNRMVCRFRIDLLNRIKDKVDTADPRYHWVWRYEEFEAVTYDQMLWQFWKPLSRFYREDPAREIW